MAELIVPGRDVGAADRIARRMHDLAANHNRLDEGHPDLPPDPWQPRWRVDAKWIEFECGCRAERCLRLGVVPEDSDPIIFRNLPEQAVYDEVCGRHGPGMNKYVHFGQYVTFQQWKRARRHLLMGRTATNG